MVQILINRIRSSTYRCNGIFTRSFASAGGIRGGVYGFYRQPIPLGKNLGYSTHFQRCMHLSSGRLGLITFKLADIGEGIAEVELLSWSKNVGDELMEMETVCEVQSDKAAVEITSRYSGKITKLYHNVGDMIKIGGPLLDVEVADEEDAIPQEVAKESTVADASAEKTAPPPKVEQSKQLNASPATRRLAKELGVDLAAIEPKGKGGMITKADVEEHAQKMKQPAAPNVVPQASSVAPEATPAADVEVSISGIGRAMFKVMTGTALIPHLWISEEVDVTSLEAIIKNLKAVQEAKGGIKLTMTPFFIKAMSIGMLKYPIINSKVHSSGEKYTIFGSHNISIAMDTEVGLLVPNVKNVQNLNILSIQTELLRLQALAKANKLSPQDLAGGTVSLSNVGVISGTAVKSLLFDGQALIAGVGKKQVLPRFGDNGNVVAKTIINWGFSADHRHCDGATVARYAAEVKALLENPELMLLYLH